MGPAAGVCIGVICLLFASNPISSIQLIATSFNITKGEEGNDTLTKLDIEAKCFIPVIGPTVNESQG